MSRKEVETAYALTISTFSDYWEDTVPPNIQKSIIDENAHPYFQKLASLTSFDESQDFYRGYNQALSNLFLWLSTLHSKGKQHQHINQLLYLILTPVRTHSTFIVEKLLK